LIVDLELNKFGMYEGEAKTAGDVKAITAKDRDIVAKNDLQLNFTV
tara:strand:- start:151 stop:288 length:138 start_codon:yes stop_codon:yes gene_type:complete